MAKKLIRIHHPNTSDLEKYLNLDLDLVMENKSVYFGQIKQIKNSEIEFRDKMNNKIVIQSQKVTELIVDQIHSF